MIKVNLLSPEKKEVAGGGIEAPQFEEQRENKISKVAIIAAAVITLSLIVYLYMDQSKTLDQLNQTLQERLARKDQLKDTLAKLDQMEKEKAEVDKKIKLISDLKKRQQDAVKMMDELLNALPDWIWLTNLTFSNRSLVIKGKTLGNNLISDFINNLKGTNSFFDIEFLGSQRQREGGMDIFDFSVTCKFRDKYKEKDFSQIGKDKNINKTTDTKNKAG